MIMICKMVVKASSPTVTLTVKFYKRSRAISLVNIFKKAPENSRHKCYGRIGPSFDGIQSHLQHNIDTSSICSVVSAQLNTVMDR